jgi:hypothetical protein
MICADNFHKSSQNPELKDGANPTARIEPFKLACSGNPALQPFVAPDAKGCIPGAMTLLLPRAVYLFSGCAKENSGSFAHFL